MHKPATRIPTENSTNHGRSGNAASRPVIANTVQTTADKVIRLPDVGVPARLEGAEPLADTL
jgi:hypothetical protein